MNLHTGTAHRYAGQTLVERRADRSENSGAKWGHPQFTVQQELRRPRICQSSAIFLPLRILFDLPTGLIANDCRGFTLRNRAAGWYNNPVEIE